MEPASSRLSRPAPGAAPRRAPACRADHEARPPPTRRPDTKRLVRAGGGQLGEAALEALDEPAVKPELARSGAGEQAVRVTARDEDRLDVALSSPAKAGHRELLLAAELVLHPRAVAAPGDVGRVKALGDDALEAELGDACDEVLGPVDHHARWRAPGGSVERQLLEQRAALRIRERPRRAVAAVKQVEDLEHRRLRSRAWPLRRRRSRAKSARPSPRRQTSSPSSVTRRLPSTPAIAASSGNSSEHSRPVRVLTDTERPSKRSCARQPSHLTPSVHASPSGTAPQVSSIGGTNVGCCSR